MLCLYLMGLNLSSRQIAQELDLIASHVQAMTEQLRTGLKARLFPGSGVLGGRKDGRGGKMPGW